jgi:hypothetical protein
MHSDHAHFLTAIETTSHVRLAFFDVKSGKDRTVVCAPLDFGPLRGASDNTARYQLWDLEATRPPYNITVYPADVRSIELLSEKFDPAAIITWQFKAKRWSVLRNWGLFS